ncbi:MAG: GGDEF and EAL domain-containing protein [Lachnospiraceae bacterium]|nr:GGDEF and EAL domain-containing protein [Lachnospiraceae bacterium]
MGEKRKEGTFNQIKEVINILSPSVDNYLYVMDIKNDIYFISANAMERFSIQKQEFHNVMETLMKFVYPSDIEILQEDLNQLLRREKNFHNLQYRWVSKEGNAVWINCRGSVISDEEGELKFLVGCINEIGEKQKADNVSGLLGEFSLQEEISNYKGERKTGFMIRLGIDNFKEINENRGMDYGDMVLKRTAECIESVILPSQMLYRIVADEFVILDFSKRGIKEAEKLFDEIRWKINLFIEDNQYEVFFTVSAGIIDFATVQGQDYSELMKRAEFSLNKAKENGKNTGYVYDEQDYNLSLRHRKLVQIMRQSVSHDFEGFETYFQPIMNMKEGRLANAETLLRFCNEEMGMVSPAEFIPLLEESGLIIPVGKWVLYQAMEACKEIQKKIPDFKISVNLSYIQVLKSDVLKEILYGVRKYELQPESLIIELTESGFLESDANFIGFCDGLKENGILLALDDFGTGYSNFHYLYNLSPNTIKIDRSFTLKALKNNYEFNLLRYMVDMVHSINLKLCIEGIETEQELSKICEIEPDYIQGYYFGKPSPLNRFLDDFVNV